MPIFSKVWSLPLLSANSEVLYCLQITNCEIHINWSTQKQKGRNRDIHVSDMANYIEMKKQIEKNTENLKQANKKSSELKLLSKITKYLI